MTKGVAAIEKCYEGMEEDCSPVSDESWFAGESFIKYGSPENDFSSMPVCPLIRS